MDVQRLTHGERGILTVLCVGTFMTSLDASIVNISLPAISADFGVSIGLTTWAILIYSLMIGSFLLTFGRLGDLFGFRRLFTIGLGLFTFGSFMCGIATDIWLLLGFRALQGFGAGMVMAVNLGMVSAYLPSTIRGRSLGYITMLAALGVAVGPVIGGYLTEYISWRAVFYINVPIGMIAVLMAIAYLPRTETDAKRNTLDVVTSLLLFLSLFSLIFVLNTAQDDGWTSPATLAFIIIGVIAAWLTFQREQRSDDPLIDRGLVKNRNVLRANFGGLIANGLIAGAFVLLPYYFELVRLYDTDHTGLILMAASLGLLFSSAVVGRLSDIMGSRPFCVIGAGVMAVGYALMAMFGEGTPIVFALAALFITGWGAGMFLVPNSNLIFSHVVRSKAGVASGLTNTFRQMGTVIAVAVMEGVFTHFITPVMHGNAMVGLVPGFRAAFLFAAAVSLLALVLSVYSHEGEEDADGAVIG